MGNFHGPRHSNGPHLTTIGVFSGLFKSKTWSKFANITVGHADAVLSVGLHDDISDSITSSNTTAKALKSSNNTSLLDDQLYEEVFEDEPEDESAHLIQLSELDSALSNAQVMMSHSHEEILAQGWKLVHQCDTFALYKRRQKRPTGDGPVEYVMKGQFLDVSPRTFLLAQIDCSLRKMWDKSMKEMSAGEITLDVIENDGSNYDGAGKVTSSRDKLYFRTKWPWPMKDRDYALARRCKIYHNESTIVFISKSHDNVTFPSKDGAVRVDNYWCHSAFMSLPHSSPTPPPISPILTTSITPDSAPAAADNPGEADNAEATTDVVNASELDNTPSTTDDDGDSVACPRATEHYKTLRLVDHFTRLHRDHSRYLRTLRCHPHYRRYQAQYVQKLRTKQRMLMRQVSRLKGVLGDARDEVLRDVEGRLEELEAGNGLLGVAEAEEGGVVGEMKETTAAEGDGAIIASLPVENRIKIRKPPRNHVCKPGMQFVTIFCDDQKVPLHPTIVDMIASHAEKVVPTSIQKLYEIAKLVEEKKISIDVNCKCEDG
eukprot:gene32813-39673_t